MNGSTTSFAHDAAGRLVQASDSLGGSLLNQYDVLDRLLAQATGLGTISYQYDALGRRTTMTAPGQAPVAYGYDAASRLTAITQGSQVVGLTYDAAGRRTRLSLPNGVSTDYQYDIASRLTALIYRNALGPLGELTYQYDAAGNRTGVGGSFARTLMPDPVLSATYNAANRQLTFGGQALTYDANGNLTSDGTSTYTWDPRNRLTTLNGPNATAAFSYEPQGRRHAKTVNGAATHYLYDGFDVVTELTDTLEVPYLRTLNIDETLGRGAEEFYLADALGSALALTSQDAALTTTYTYASFGATVVDNATSPNAFQFTGRQNDGTGLYYYRARYYAPQLGRFISEDPLRSLNLYSYAGNNPILATDPLGLRTAVVAGGPGLSGPGAGGLGLSGESMQALGDVLAKAGEPVIVFNSNQQELAFAWLRAGAGAGEPANIVCHSYGCGRTLSGLRGANAPQIDRLVTLDCAASPSCGSVPDNVDFNLNIYQTQGILRGQANIRSGGGMAGIANVNVTGRGWTHTQIPQRREVQNAVRACIQAGDCSGKGLGGRK